MLRALALLLALVATACAGAGSERPRIVATVYPLVWLAQQVAPDAEVTGLVTGGQDAHDVDLSPQQRAQLEAADVVAYLGPIGFQPQVESAVGTLDVPTADAAAAIGQDRLLPAEGGGHDPHLWFDADLLATVALALGEAAAAADPGAAPEYQANAERVAAELRGLADEVGALLADCRFDQVIVSHEAYAYLLVPHGLEQLGVSHAGGHDQASPQRLAELVAAIRAEQVPAVLTEPVEGRTDAEALAREAGVDLVEIYSLDIVDEAQAAKGFPQLLREQAAAVAQAAGCEGGR